MPHSTFFSHPTTSIAPEAKAAKATTSLPKPCHGTISKTPAKPTAKTKTENRKMSDEFIEAITSIENARSAVSAVAVARDRLDTRREKAVAFLDEFEAHRASHEPFLREATDKYNRAYLVGVSVPSLRATLHEAWTSLEAAPAAAAAVIQRIDTLTEYSLYQGHDVY